jgi:hypothetical protein
MSDAVHDYLVEIGRNGGAAGSGTAKARTSEQARAAARARWVKRVKARKEKKDNTMNAKKEIRNIRKQSKPATFWSATLKRFVTVPE